MLLFRPTNMMEAMHGWSYHDPAFEHTLPGAWGGHRRFGYDLVRNLRPARIVELGVCWGISFFAFCQAVKDAGLRTEMWAVDTWEGDEHTGRYGPEIFEGFERVRRENYSALDVRTLRTGFDEARRRFHGPADVLHLDGCHTYEAARHDYETWADAVAEDGVILFHDVAERSEGFGVWRLWDELRERFQTVAFEHSHGLGVLFKSPRFGDPRLVQEEWRARYATEAPGGS
jgi:hypothetical protein